MSDVQIFHKPYLFHPDSELDVLYMDFDVRRDLSNGEAHIAF
jgi:hypothetical protein